MKDQKRLETCGKHGKVEDVNPTLSVTKRSDLKAKVGRRV